VEAMITILREPNNLGVREPDTVPESQLVKSTGREETDDYIAEWVEYRFPNTELVVHRSAHITMKKLPAEIAGVAQPLG
jgi:hypothetical protein